MKRIACLLILALTLQGCYTTRHHHRLVSKSDFNKGVLVIAGAALVVDVISYAIRRSIDRRHKRKVTEDEYEIRRRWRDSLEARE